MIKIAVTGGMGFIGQEFLARYGERYEVTVVDYYRELLADYEHEKYPCLPRVYQSLAAARNVVTPQEFLADLVRLGPQVIVHLGAVTDTTDMGWDKAYGEMALWSENVDYARQLCNYASELGSHVVFASSAATYGNHGVPINPYGLSKTMGEKIMAEMKTRSVSLRFFNVFGRYEDHKDKMASLPFKLNQAYEQRLNAPGAEKLRLHSPDAKRDFVPVSTVAGVLNDVTDKLAGPMKSGERRTVVRDLGTGRGTPIKQLDSWMKQIHGTEDSAVEWVDIPTELVSRYQVDTVAEPIQPMSESTYRGMIENYSPENIDVE